MDIVLLGPPGVGKGTQGDLLARRLGIPKVATGDVLRAARREGTPLGRKAQAAMDRGDLVPDSVILGILKEALAAPGAREGAILDGAVRTIPQAEGVQSVLRELGRQVDVVLLLEADEDELVRRLSGRTTCERCQTPQFGREPGTPCPRCGGALERRADDEPEAVRNRLRVYREQTAPVIDWYGSNGGRVVPVNAAGTVDEVTARIVRALGGA
jgi:adenylate kinase